MSKSKSIMQYSVLAEGRVPVKRNIDDWFTTCRTISLARPFFHPKSIRPDHFYLDHFFCDRTIGFTYLYIVCMDKYKVIKTIDYRGT